MTGKKVAIITGSAGGIGRATALRYFNEGYHLVLSDIDGEGLTSLTNDLESSGKSGNQIAILSGDLADPSYLKSLVEECRKRWNRVDVLVNNAIWRTHNTMRTITHENWEKTMAIGLTAPAFLSKWTAELMEEKRIKGVVVNVSSIMSQRAGGTNPAYVACKGALESLTYELASLYGPSGIRIVGLAPGNTLTPLSCDFESPLGENLSKKIERNMHDQTPLRRSGKASEIASTIYWLTSREASFVTGTVLQVDGGFSHSFSHYSLKKLQFPREF